MAQIQAIIAAQARGDASGVRDPDNPVTQAIDLKHYRESGDSSAERDATIITMLRDLGERLGRVERTLDNPPPFGGAAPRPSAPYNPVITPSAASATAAASGVLPTSLLGRAKTLMSGSREPTVVGLNPAIGPL